MFWKEANVRVRLIFPECFSLLLSRTITMTLLLVILTHFLGFGVVVFFFVFLGPHPQHMEVPRLGVESEMQLPAYTTATEMLDLSRICDLHHWLMVMLNP